MCVFVVKALQLFRNKTPVGRRRVRPKEQRVWRAVSHVLWFLPSSLHCAHRKNGLHFLGQNPVSEISPAARARKSWLLINYQAIRLCCCCFPPCVLRRFLSFNSVCCVRLSLSLAASPHKYTDAFIYIFTMIFCSRWYSLINSLSEMWIKRDYKMCGESIIIWRQAQRSRQQTPAIWAKIEL